MYQKFFGFSESPFSLTPDPKFFYASREHEEALSHILFGIQERKGFIVISGEVGTGKTTLCRHVLARLDPKVKTALIFNPNLTTLELLRTINQDFGLPGAGVTKKELVDELNAFLLDALAKKGNALLIIDEAQNLPIECLEEIRMLSNLETTKDKLLQILLIGQPELREKLNLRELRQLNQRVALRYHLEPLSREETRSYIGHRLRKAGRPDTVAFADAAIRMIHQASGGVPRLINITCDKALLAAYVAETKKIDTRIVRKAVKELADRPAPPPARATVSGAGGRTPAMRWGFGIAAALLVTLGVVLAYPRAVRFLEAGRSPAERPVAVPSSEEPRPFLPVAPEAAVPFAFDLHGTYRVADPVDTAPAAALTLLRRWGVPGTGLAQEDIRRLREQDFDRWMGEQGFSVFRFPADLQRIARLGLPAIIQLAVQNAGGTGGEHWAVLSRLDDETATLLDPLAGETRITADEFRRTLSGNAVVIYRPLPGVALPFSEAKKDDVRALQSVLLEKGFFQGEINGRWGESCAQAVRFLQQKAGLPESGLLTTDSYIVLSRIVLGDRAPSLADSA